MLKQLNTRIWISCILKCRQQNQYTQYAFESLSTFCTIIINIKPYSQHMCDFQHFRKIKSILILEYQHKSTQVNTNPTKHNTNQHEPNTSRQHEYNTSQQESTRVWHKPTRVQRELTQVGYQSTRASNKSRSRVKE